MSEYMNPKEVVTFLNRYYTIMTGPINKHNGSISQYVGDEIFATFGAPINCSDNEQNPVFCALDMMEKLKELISEAWVTMRRVNWDVQHYCVFTSNNRIHYPLAKNLATFLEGEGWHVRVKELTRNYQFTIYSDLDAISA